MQESYAVVSEQTLALAEERVVKAHAYVLEHADRHNAVEAPLNIAIVHEPKCRIRGAATLQRSVLCALVLLLRQRDAGDTRPG